MRPPAGKKNVFERKGFREEDYSQLGLFLEITPSCMVKPSRLPALTCMQRKRMGLSFAAHTQRAPAGAMRKQSPAFRGSSSPSMYS